MSLPSMADSLLGPLSSFTASVSTDPACPAGLLITLHWAPPHSVGQSRASLRGAQLPCQKALAQGGPRDTHCPTLWSWRTMAPSCLLSWSLGTIPSKAEGERQPCRGSRED